MSSDSPIRRLVVQASHYGLTSLFAMIAGLISFPVLTRLFSVADYGTMSLVAATLTATVAVGKLGVQHSTLRYYSEIDAGKSPYTMPQLFATTLFGMGGSAIVVMVVLTIFARVAPVAWLGDERLRHLFAIVSILLLVQVLESAVVNFLRADQRTTEFMKYQVAKKYFGLGAMLTVVIFVSRTLTAFYSINVVTDTLCFVALAVWTFGRPGRRWPRLADFSRPMYRELLVFGIPMMLGYELSGLILSVGDRYVIGAMVGEQPLGLYAAGYNLCQYVQALVIVSLSQAITPIYMRMWDHQGAEATSAFINRSLRTYALFGIPIIAGLAAVGGELLPSLASEKYASAAVILPWVIAGMVVDGANSMVGAGLFIHRKTRTIMSIVFSSALLNIVLNVVLVPRIGILGSAIATLVCYAAAAFGMAWAGRTLLPITMPWPTLLHATVASLAMYFAAARVLPGRRLLSVGVRTGVGVIVYGAIMVLISPSARELARGALQRVRKRGAAS